MGKSVKAHFLKLHVQQAISETLYELGTPGVDLFNSLKSALDDFTLKSKLTDFTRSHGFLKRITNIIIYWNGKVG